MVKNRSSRVCAVGSLDLDTRLAGEAGRYAATLSEDWRIWGPNGGYVAAIALRAAGAASKFRRPVSFACHFLGVGAFGPADVTVVPLRSARTAESLRVTLAQEGRAFLDATVWTTDATAGLEHDFAPMPDVPKPGELRSFQELEQDSTPPRFPFWMNLEGRPTDWVPRAAWKPRAPRLCNWYRFRPDARFDDPFLDAARALILQDTLSWPAACQAHREEDNPWMAPSLDVAARFHRAPPFGEWLLCEARADVATEGLIGFHNRVWDEAGRLVASGGGQLLCRPRPAGG
jgi:acyl-CoA thioesterase II